MPAFSRSPFLAWLGLGLMLLASALLSWGIAEAGRVLLPRLGSPTVWQVLAGLVVAWVIALFLPDRVGGPIGRLLPWWIVGTAIAALGLVVARGVDASAEGLYRVDACWLGLRDALGAVFKYGLLPALVASGWFLSLLYARPLVVYFRSGSRLLDRASVLLTILTAASSFSFFTADGLDRQAAENDDMRRGDVALALRQTDELIAAAEARHKLARAMDDDREAAAKALRQLLESRLACATDRLSCLAALDALPMAGDFVPKRPTAARAEPTLPPAFARPAGTAQELREQVSDQHRIHRDRDAAAEKAKASAEELREASRAVVESARGQLAGLLAVPELPNLGKLVDSVAEFVFELGLQSLIGDKTVDNLAGLWQRLVDTAGRAIDQARDFHQRVHARDGLAARAGGLNERIIEDRLKEAMDRLRGGER